MKKEYDFSQAKQGRFYRTADKLELPVYLDKEVKEFFARRAEEKNARLDKVINIILRKEMEILKKI